jgi:DNA primase/KaiC/GvpD/RAD55 family RecA-like ATPase
METGDLQYEALLEVVRDRLPEYLSGHGITWDKEGKFRCIHPDHEDRDPSCHFVDVEGVAPRTRFKCFGCGRWGDIFTAATWLDGKPTEGKSWLVDNVYWLADQFGIAYERVELSEEEYLIIKQQRLFNDTAQALVDLCKATPDYYGHATSRGVTPETCEKFGIGSVPWPALMASLKKLDWDEGFVKSSGIDEHHFGPDYLTFTLRNMNGTVVGFDRRYMKYDVVTHRQYRKAGKHYPQKFMATSQKKCKLIDKSTLLYNVHWARDKPLRRLDVFEGFMDWVTAYQAGHRCCTAVCGSELTEGMVAVIRSCGFHHVNLVLDSDDVGLKKMEKALQKFKGIEGLHVTIMPLRFQDDVPPSQRDVDTYIRAFGSPSEGLANFLMHQEVTAFDWLLDKRVNEGGAPKVVAGEMVGFIVNEKSQVDRGILCKVLASKLGIPESDIRAEVDSIANKKLDEIASGVAHRIRRAHNTHQRVQALEDGVSLLRATMSSGADAITNPEESAKFIKDTFKEFMSTPEGILGWKTRFPILDRDLNGIPKKEGLLVFGGIPNTGKSVLLLNLTYGLIEENPEPTVIFFSFDDARRISQAKLAAAVSGLPISTIMQPAAGMNTIPDFKQKYQDVAKKLIDWAESGRLVLKGREIGNTISSMEMAIRSTMDRIGRPVIVIVDSFHKVRGGKQDERLNFKEASDWCQRMIVDPGMTVVCSGNCTKASFEKFRLRMDDLGETIEIAYDAKLVGMVHNDVDRAKGRAKIFWDDSGMVQPVLEIDIDKNKIMSTKPTWYFKLRQATSQLWETSYDKMQEEISARKEVGPPALPSDPKQLAGPPIRSFT